MRENCVGEGGNHRRKGTEIALGNRNDQRAAEEKDGKEEKKRQTNQERKEIRP